MHIPSTRHILKMIEGLLSFSNIAVIATIYLIITLPVRLVINSIILFENPINKEAIIIFSSILIYGILILIFLKLSHKHKTAKQKWIKNYIAGLKENIFIDVCVIIKDLSGIDSSLISKDTCFNNKTISLKNRKEILNSIEKKYGIKFQPYSLIKIKTVSDLIILTRRRFNNSIQSRIRLYNYAYDMYNSASEKTPSIHYIN